MRTLLRIFLLCSVAAASGCAHLPMQKGAAADVAEPPPQARAALALQHNDYQEALRLYRERLEQAPRDRAALLGTGEAWLGLGESRQALRAFTQVLELDAGNVDALEGSGLAYLGLQQYDKASERLLKFVMQRPQSWRAQNALGLIADMKGQYNESATWYEKALNAKDDEASIYNNYGYSRIMAGQYVQAETLLRRAMQLSPDNQRVRNNLMQAVAWQGRYDEAVGLRGDIPLPVALNNVGYIAWLRHEKPAAIALLQRALDESPTWYRLAANNLEIIRQTPVPLAQK